MPKTETRETYNIVMRWAEDRDYTVLACIPLEPRRGYLPQCAMLVDRGSEYVAWTACIESNGDVSFNHGWYSGHLSTAMKALMVKCGLITSAEVDAA